MAPRITIFSSASSTRRIESITSRACFIIGGAVSLPPPIISGASLAHLETGRLALEAHLERRQEVGHVTVDWSTHAYWIKRQLHEAKKISIIIPVRDRVDLLARCLASLTSKTTYAPYEIVVVDNDSQSEEARAYFSQFEHRLLRYSGPFNYSAINNFAVETNRQSLVALSEQ